jgi:hypothetical protein
MALNFEETSTSSNTPIDNIPLEDNDDFFYAIIDRLKVQKALPQDSFVKEMPFFNFSSISKESQLKELFQDISDPSFYKSLIKNVLSLPDEKNPDLITKRLSAMQVMGFAQIVLYKVLLCPDENCPNRPREIATHNQYKDYEYQCPFYHHDKDRRRMVITSNIGDEFIYKANYFEEGKRGFEKGKHSQNYFESMFHPLYYKMFRCKREYCNFAQFCPFYHSEEEKKTWDRTFSNFIRKDRISYVKDKQKYYEHNSHAHHNNNSETRILRAGSDQYNNRSTPTTNTNSNPNSPNNNTPRTKQNQNRKPKYNKMPQEISPNQQAQGDWKTEKSFKPNSGKKWENKKKTPTNSRKDSGESLEGNSSPVTFGHFCDHKEALTNRAC